MRNNKSTQNDHTRQILADIQTMDSDELLTIHGITINADDGSVYDQAYDKSFTNVDEWVNFSSGDEDNEFEKFGGNYGYDDDY